MPSPQRSSSSISTSSSNHPPLPSYPEALANLGEKSTTLSPTPRNGIPVQARRSMEDELRPLPRGWTREFDPVSQHQFFVDTNSPAPHRSIWTHPYDDDVFLSSLPLEERLQIEENYSGRYDRGPSAEDIAAETTDDDDDDSDTTTLCPSSSPKKRSGFGQKLKDKITGKSRSQRIQERAERCAAEKEMYRQHRILRKGMTDAMISGRPQLLGRDSDRKHVFLEPPGHTYPYVTKVQKVSPYLSEVFYDDSQRPTARPAGRYMRPEGEMYGCGYGGYGCGKFAGGRWDKPADKYERKKGSGFGGGLGFPLMMPMLGGLALGGMMGVGF
ncbi:hypothetical protein QBC35DRAFT_389118 [Podospora australis]|uniref:WW domain-containing protein n=1 Tax=Podospora australis TaxID=1536484 RepID=A0AAN6WPH0_9PEZI|nr:hypothetical protein QBC35DRAFT_389118 [Podospora australis]